MRGHAQTIAGEVDRMVAGWAREGEIDLLNWFAELTINTSSAETFRDAVAWLRAAGHLSGAAQPGGART
jgi:cytochrome P450